jgi:hypothetical protein
MSKPSVLAVAKRSGPSIKRAILFHSLVPWREGEVALKLELDNVFASLEFLTSEAYSRGDRRGWTVAGRDQFLVFDTTVRRRGRAWRWFVSTTKGVVVMCGSERRRSSATYQARRALFLLLSAGPCRSVRPGKSLERLNRFVPHGADGNSLKNSGVDAGPTKGGATGAE